MITRLIYALLIMAFCVPLRSEACTTVLVSAKASATGRPIMWKHRDSNSENSFIERVEAVNGHLGYVALFDSGDTRLSQAWIGMNDAGFAIMNSASYNLQPDTARIKDREGYLMSIALQQCRTIADFESLLNRFPQPRGVQANFGVMDSAGGLMYFEVNDHNYKKFNVNDAPEGYMVRTNFSIAGEKGAGRGYIRYSDINELIAAELAAGSLLSPQFFTEKASRSFYHSLFKADMLQSADQWLVDQDFIPRYISNSSVVIEGINPGKPVKDMVMWAALGYPPCSVALMATLNFVPNELRPVAEGFRSPICNQIQALKAKVFPITLEDGKKYINAKALRQFIESSSAISKKNYDQHYAPAPTEK